MSDRVFPASKPAANSTAPPPPAKPPLRPPYRPQPHARRHHRPRRNYCCCCCFWTVLIVLILALLAAIAATALYVLYRPHRPSFSIPSLRTHRLNLTSSADSSSNHLATLFNLTVTSKNPNSHITFSYDPFVISALSSNDVFLGNGTVPGFFSDKKNQTVFKNVVVSGSSDLDTDSVTSLKSDLKKKSGVSLKIQLDTKVKVKLGKLKSKKVGIRVTCEGIKGEVPKGQVNQLG
ncbi:Late embryogenesis abundant (LEA) hydroxyproline-rich glycoprotein family [Melia azedarach]|uniref:Late embryogenesis abundant (LEA) hydroxyproline-rich glycoprotein family n=1 Tax=Melia azedarach TaxID=155640 RepID=A0ACC1X9Q3_MELAZ|nr:Late embryogenesis abundant (LEA) hydroxyproline-rich glycoprotein family [Melia azedarach]